MNSFRNNPDSPENEAMTTDNERDVFAAKMQGREPTEADETEFIEYKARYAQAKQTVLAAQMQAKADARSPLLKEMDGLLASAVHRKCCWQTIALLEEAIMHQEFAEDAAKEP